MGENLGDGANRDYSNQDHLQQSRPRRKVPASVSPARSAVQSKRGRLLEATTEVLEQAGEPMKVSVVHAAVEELLAETVSYRSIKDTLSGHARGRSRRFLQVRRGWYGLSAAARS